MRITVFSSQPHDETSLTAANHQGYELQFLKARLSADTAILAQGSGAVCCFVNDELNARTLEQLAELGVRHILLRSAGFNHVDTEAAARLGLGVARVPAYSPYAVAEHTLALVLCLNRRIHRAYNRVRELDFSLQGLMGFDLHDKRVAVVGTGRIGAAFCRALLGLGCHVRAYDPAPSQDLKASGVEYVEFDAVVAGADIVSLHCPLSPSTRHMVGAAFLERMKPGAMLINTSRGALLDTRAVIMALKRGKLGALGIDVYEEEEQLFFADHSEDIMQDDVFARLLTFPNVLITGHQGFFTREAVTAIAETTMANLDGLIHGHLGAAHCVVAGPS